MNISNYLKNAVKRIVPSLRNAEYVKRLEQTRTYAAMFRSECSLRKELFEEVTQESQNTDLSDLVNRFSEALLKVLTGTRALTDHAYAQAVAWKDTPQLRKEHFEFYLTAAPLPGTDCPLERSLHLKRLALPFPDEIPKIVPICKNLDSQDCKHPHNILLVAQIMRTNRQLEMVYLKHHLAQLPSQYNRK